MSENLDPSATPVVCNNRSKYDDTHELLRELERTQSWPAVVGYHRIDGPGSSLSLPLFQIAFYRKSPIPLDKAIDKSWEWSAEFPRTVAWTVSTGTKVTAKPFPRGKLAMKSADYPELRHVEAPVGRIPPRRENWVLKIMEAFGLDGVLFELQNLDARTASAGLGGSAAATTASVMLANYLSGALMTKSQVVAMASMWENNLEVSMTGVQEQWNVVEGGIRDYVWFPCGAPSGGIGYGDAIHRKLMDAEHARELLDRSILVHTGRGRMSADINKIWSLQLRTDSGHRLIKEQTGLAYRYAEALRRGEWRDVQMAIDGYRDIRTSLCPAYIDSTEWLNGMADEHDASIFPLGAGGGGCALLWSADAQKVSNLRRVIKADFPQRVIDFELRNSGHSLINPIPGLSSSLLGVELRFSRPPLHVAGIMLECCLFKQLRNGDLGQIRERNAIVMAKASQVKPGRLGVIFDMNGTMVDDQPFQRNAWRTVCARYGRTISDEEYQLHVAGHNEKDVIAYLFGPDYPDKKGNQLGEEKRKLYRETFDPVAAEVPGLRALLSDLEHDGVPVALATSASRATLDFILDRLGIRSSFRVIVQGSEVPRGKPAPDIYLLTAREIGLNPVCCVVFEDSSAGVASAKAAGMKCVGLTTTLSREDLLAESADLVIADFREIQLCDLMSIIEGGRPQGRA